MLIGNPASGLEVRGKYPSTPGLDKCLDCKGVDKTRGGRGGGGKLIKLDDEFVLLARRKTAIMCTHPK